MKMYDLPYLLIICLALLCFGGGVYQVLTGKNTFLMHRLNRKYHFTDGFARTYGYYMLSIACVLFIALLGAFLERMVVIEIAFVVLCIFAFLEPFMVQKYQRNIEGINKKALFISNFFVVLIVGIWVYFR